MYVDILILSHLAHRPAHGYEIKKGVERTLGDGFAINNNALYPALRRFEEMGAVVREVERTPGRPDRHVYRLTDRGDEVLQGLLREFPPDLARSDEEFMVRVAFFDLLDPSARLDILRAREAVLRRYLAHVEQESPRAAQAGRGYAMRVIQFQAHQIQQELAWIASLVREAEKEKEDRP